MYNFALLTITYTRLGLGLRVHIATTRICHLTLYWTDKEPWRHHTTRLVRGLLVPWGTYFCFVAWHAVEQNEAGDTFTHTFDLPAWLYCQTRWFTFRGTVGPNISPSGTPIFEKHNSFIPYTLYQHYNGPTDTATLTNGTKRLAMTFLPQQFQNIAQLKLLLSRLGLPGTITVAIEGTLPTGRPNDTILTGGTFNGDDLPPLVPGPAAWATIPIDPYALTPGTLYAIVLFSGIPGSKIAWSTLSSDAYPPGRAWAWIAGPDNWFPTLDWTRAFETWGYYP